MVQLLLFRSPDDGRMAVALAQVARLEELKVEQVETTGGQDVVQYRDNIMPLVRVFDILPERRKDLRNPTCGVPAGVLPVVVHQRGDRPIGLVVGEILDTVDADLAQLRPASRPGVQGCLVIQGKVTEVLDVEAVLRTALPAYAQSVHAAQVGV
jgi:two-component system chemotaxis sensor kinase CheA